MTDLNPQQQKALQIITTFKNDVKSAENELKTTVKRIKDDELKKAQVTVQKNDEDNASNLEKQLSNM